MAVRVLWVVKGLGPGGAERLLAAAARAHDPAQVQIECAYVLPHKDHLTAALEEAGVRCTCLSGRAGDPRWPLALRDHIAQGAFDVVHVHSPVPGSVARAAVRSMPTARRPATMSTEHNTWARHRAATRWANRLTGRWDAATYAVSAETLASMSGPAGARGQVLVHGIDVERVAGHRAERAEVRAELQIGPDEPVVGTVANMTRQKDYPNLLAAARSMLDRGLPVRVVAVGQGPLEDEVREAVTRLGLGESVLITGFRDDAVRVMAAFDVFTLASAWEGLPVALMEALALGLPVVATRVGGVAEALREGADALLVPAGDSAALADAWQRLLTDDELRARLAAASQARAADFDAARAVQHLEATYCRLARSWPQDPPAEAPATRVTPSSGLDIRPAAPDDRPAILDLLQRSLGGDDPRYADFFAWKHDDNPYGPSPMWVATDGGRVVAFRTFLRWEFVRGGRVVRAVRAVDTATDPEYRGRGLFRELTLRGAEEMRAEGVAFVFNTPNDQSRPGYLSMGWRDVGRLPVAVRFSDPGAAVRALRSRVAAARWSQLLDVGEPAREWLARLSSVPSRARAPHERALTTRLSLDVLRWRYGSAVLDYRVLEGSASATIVRARRRGASTELAVVASFGDPVDADRTAARALRDTRGDYAIRLGAPDWAGAFAPLPAAGPRLTWRGLSDAGMPPLPNWAVTLGDIELF